MKLNKETCFLIKMLKEYSPTTYEHSVRVALIAADFGKFVGKSDEEIEKLKVAGFLHDIGKLLTPDIILHKKGLLTKEEYEQIKAHPENGVELLKRAKFDDEEILNYILSHHERLDNKGYPRGLGETELTDLGKIITICDCFDAMKFRRVYKETHDMNFIKNELINNAGTQFDKYYVDLFLEYLENDKIIKL